jgi:uncharacterized protein (DUF1778 family)
VSPEVRHRPRTSQSDSAPRTAIYLEVTYDVRVRARIAAALEGTSLAELVRAAIVRESAAVLERHNMEVVA